MPIVVFSIFLIGLLVGSFCDLQLAKAMYFPDNFLSYYVEYMATFPTAILVSLAGVFLFLYFKHNSKIKYSSTYAYLSLVIVPISGAVWGYDCFSEKIYALLGAVIVIPFAYLFYLYYKRRYEDNFARIAFVIILATITSIIFTFGIKISFNRPRFYYLKEIAEDYSLYKDWYKIALKFVDKTEYPQLVENTYIQSFPSGHSSFSALLYLLLLLPYNFKNKRNSHITFIVVTIYTLLAMLGRMMNGRHYLSDVSMGYLIGSLSSFVYMIFIPKDLFVKDKNIPKRKTLLIEDLH